MMTSPKVLLKTRSARPLAALASRILNSWRWNSRLASGFATSVNTAVTAVIARATVSTLTPAALSAMTSRSPARRPPARRIATSSAMGRVWARKEGSM